MKKYIRRTIPVLLAIFMLLPLIVIQASAATTYERKLGVPVDYQFNYTTVRYGTNKSVKTSGCGAASASMVVEYYTGNTSQTPDTLFTWACNNGWYTGNGLSYAAVKQLCANYGVTLTWVGTKAEIISALKAGHPIIALMGAGTFTSGGHYIVLSGIKVVDGTTYIRVNDPNSSSRTNSYYTLDLIWEEKRTSSSTPFGVCSYSKDPQGKSGDFYVEPGKYSKVVSSDGSLNIRSTASSSGTVLGTIPSGTYIMVSSISGNWAYVTYNGVSGYVYTSYLKDGGQVTVSAPTLSTPTATAYGNTATVSWNAVSGATSYSYSATLYEGEISVGNGKSIASGTTTSTSFTVPAQTLGKYVRVSVTATGSTNSASSTADIMLGPWVAYPSDVQYIPVADVNGSVGSSNSTVWTASKASAFGAVYWTAALCSANTDGTYTVKAVYASGSAKSVTPSGTDIVLGIHESYTNHAYAANLVVGDKLTLCGIYLDKATIRGSGYILVNGGIPLAPSDITSADSNISKASSTAFRGFGENVTVATAKTKFVENGDYMQIRDASGVLASDASIIGTGYTVNIVVNNSVKVSYALVVAGDLNGDGIITATDYVALGKVLNNSAVMQGAYELAADVDNNGSVTTSDYILLNGHINGTQTITG